MDNKVKLTDVYCTYTGGGIYVVTARYGEVYIASDLETYGSYDVPYDDIENKYGCDYDGHWKNSPVPYPTWAELYEAIKESHESGHSPNLDLFEVECELKTCHPVMDQPINWPDQEPAAESKLDNRVQIVNEFIEIFEEFLDEKGIIIQNDEKEQSPDSACNIYGTDYGDLQGKIEYLLVSLGVFKEE